MLAEPYTLDYIKKFDKSGKEVRSIHSDTHLPGIVGLNNIKANDYCNVIPKRWREGTNHPTSDRGIGYQVSDPDQQRYHQAAVVDTVWHKKLQGCFKLDFKNESHQASTKSDLLGDLAELDLRVSSRSNVVNALALPDTRIMVYKGFWRHSSTGA